jgi:hypothetical protein
VTKHSEPARAASSTAPVLVIVDADRQARLATEAALARRFEPDYRVVTADSAPHAGESRPSRAGCRSRGVPLIGAEPHTDWLRGVVELDERGFVLTGQDIPQPEWPGSRAPLPFETSVPGVFVAGDVRYGSVKRVAGAVGEGSVTVGSVHRYLASAAEINPSSPEPDRNGGQR